MKKVINKQIWVLKDKDTFIFGLTNEGQDDFGNVTFVMLPKVGDKLEVGDTFAELEAEKAVTELITPLAGTIVEINNESLQTPSVLDNPEERKAWMIVMTDVSEEAFLNLD
ncbi:glycine cleavage system protein H [Vagococcus intermedius]|uniref:Glycine cleavage system protein H n=1 Tax=Vagococcus intermedius TaxID=2991418 RepID=A0AAF0CTY5_9ENTE|nr:glycine cleavage system protein H [Vagococcus intermedius]WEG72954.1 glycine cleavage system protein H [Vagococcus intermedius]WEG75040.1 glycine cleavage system protein H [Vagococcus intermedius]